MLSLLKNIGRNNVTYVPSGIMTFYNIQNDGNLITIIDTRSYALKKGTNIKPTSSHLLQRLVTGYYQFRELFTVRLKVN